MKEFCDDDLEFDTSEEEDDEEEFVEPDYDDVE